MFFPDNLDDIKRVIDDDGVILYPTDTIWGLGCNPFSEKAVSRLYSLKQRERSKALILLVDGISMLKHYVNKIHPRVETLLVYHDKPLTVIYPEPKNVPPYNMGDFDSIAIRIVKDPFCQALIGHLGHPITSTSANFSHSDFPKHFAEIDTKLKEGCDYIVQYRQDDPKEGAPSVIINYNEKGNFNFIRE